MRAHFHRLVVTIAVGLLHVACVSGPGPTQTATRPRSGSPDREPDPSAIRT